MKQIITLLLAIIICFSIGIPAAFAADNSIPDFDYTKLTGKESGFEYNNETGEWSWQHQCTMKYSDASATVGFRTMGVTNPDFVCLYAKILDPNGEKFATVTGIKIVVESDTFQYEKMMTTDDESYVLLGENGNLLIEAIAYCNSEQVSFTIYYDDNYLTLPFDSSMIASTMKTYCLEYVRKGLWLYNRHKDTFERAEELFPLHVNGIIADYKTMHKEHSDIIKPITMEEIMERTPKNTQPTATPSSKKENVTHSFTNPKEEYDIASGTTIGTGIYIGGRDIPVGRYYAVLQGKTSYCDVNIYPSKQDYYDYEKDYSGTRLTSAVLAPGDFNQKVPGDFRHFAPEDFRQS